VQITRSLSLLKRGAQNLLLNRPLCVSFEVTRNCNARCRHCHLGEPLNEKRAAPEVFGRICRELKPVVAQVSGGEPLLRDDIEAIVRALQRKNRAPVIVLTTNGSLLTLEKYQRLLAAGVDHFSVSFDFPDQRHDEFRKIPGLFARITDLLEALNANGGHAVTLACVVHRENLRDLLDIAELGRKWRAHVNFSTYTWMRTRERELLIPPEEIAELKSTIDRLREHKRRYGIVRTSDFVFRKMIEYFELGALPGCRAGERFLVVNPDGSFSPCGLIMGEYRTQDEVVRQFSQSNTCADCYTSIRGNSEKPVRYLIADNLGGH
jgi:MoaA/NifB/PqqE/SkfB family radical SAM enzyme